jgi:hypothetical protein
MKSIASNALDAFSVAVFIGGLAIVAAAWPIAALSRRLCGES